MLLCKKREVLIVSLLSEPTNCHPSKMNWLELVVICTPACIKNHPQAQGSSPVTRLHVISFLRLTCYFNISSRQPQ